jgi:lysophospholipase L1-like esterase
LARARHTTAEFDVEIAISARGFRGPEWPQILGQDGRKTVLVLGDSFALGWGVEQSEGLAGCLAAVHPEWDVLNAAVSGYGTDQQLLLLQCLLPDVRPDLVVCVFCANELWESMADMAYGRRKPRFRSVAFALQLDGVPVPSSLLDREPHRGRFPIDGHWNAVGHAAVAQGLAAPIH